MFNGEIIFHPAFKKDTEKVMLLEVKGLKIIRNRAPYSIYTK